MCQAVRGEPLPHQAHQRPDVGRGDRLQRPVPQGRQDPVPQLTVIATAGRLPHRLRRQPPPGIAAQAPPRQPRVHIRPAQQVRPAPAPRTVRRPASGRTTAPDAARRHPDTGPATAAPRRTDPARSWCRPAAPATTGPRCVPSPSPPDQAASPPPGTYAAVDAGAVDKPDKAPPGQPGTQPSPGRAWAVCGPSQPHAGPERPERSRCKHARQSRRDPQTTATARTPTAMSGPIRPRNVAPGQRTSG